jgi:hypothetical protein
MELQFSNQHQKGTAGQHMIIEREKLAVVIFRILRAFLFTINH